MGKIVSIIIGLTLVVLGGFFLREYLREVLLVLKGTVPGILFFVGAILLVAGVSEVKDTIKAKKK